MRFNQVRRYAIRVSAKGDGLGGPRRLAPKANPHSRPCSPPFFFPLPEIATQRSPANGLKTGSVAT
jgi:hypothetical protein